MRALTPSMDESIDRFIAVNRLLEVVETSGDGV
jgi:hypothetical protein